MQFVRYTTGSTPQWGLRRDDEIVPLAGMREDVTYQQLTDGGFQSVVGDAAADRAVPTEDARLLAPVPRPGKIVCVGLNYHDHAGEQDEDAPERPLLFGKAGTSVTNPGDPIVNPAEIEELDDEDEQYLRGKSYDTFAPMGPTLAGDEVDVEIEGIGTLTSHVIDE